MIAVGKTHRSVDRVPGIEILDVEKPKLVKSTDVLLKIKAVGICGSELPAYTTGVSQYLEKPHTPKLPAILGHELCGDVIRVGSACKRIKVGDRVATESRLGCMVCDVCRSGRAPICPNMTLNIRGMATYKVTPEYSCVKIPDEISDEEGACLEPLGVASHAIEWACLQADSTRHTMGILGDAIMIQGCGPIGLFAQILAKAGGAAPVITSEVTPERIELSKKLGATAVIDATRENVVERAMEITEGRGADVVYVTGAVPDYLTSSMKIIAYSGVILTTGPFPLEETITGSVISHFKSREGQLVCNMGRLQFSSWDRNIRLVKNKTIDIKPVITHRLSLEEGIKGFELSSKGKCGKVLFKP